MYDKELVLEILKRLDDTARTILQRFESVRSTEDFTRSPEGMEKLDKITEGNLLPKYPQVDWKKAKGLRDIISHHYFDIDAEEIFHLCATRIKPMRKTIRQIIKDVS